MYNNNSYIIIITHIKVTVAYVLMSSRTTRDYESVFRKLLEIMNNTMACTWIMIDYEKAAWRAVRTVSLT